ncbi:MAG TPA: hypothetical protein VEK57_06695 [Thermoanaerobaculia bacterium]|nr:hypothetical protein [Thermoanaerobaculia bacterium]
MKKSKPAPKYDFGLSKKAAAAKKARPLPKVDAEKILSELARMRSEIPILKDKPPRKPDPKALDGRYDALSEEEFELMAVADGLQALADDLSETLDEQNAKLMENAMEVYYTAVELIEDPEHADLIPHVEAMRAAYIKDFGHPPPPRPPKKKEEEEG